MKNKFGKKKVFKKGDQCVSNPKTHKFRQQIKKNYFTHRASKKGLTLGALEMHNEEMEELNFNDLAISEKTFASTKSQAFSISGLTDCTNMSFCGVLKKWQSTNSLDQEKCAILAAVTEVIRAKGGSETESEYFAALMTTLSSDNCKSEGSVAATSYLLSLVIKKIPVSILKVKFSESAKVFMEHLAQYYDNGKSSLLIGLLECFSTCLLAAEGAVWTESSTQQFLQALLMFTTHTKPKVRKAAHHGIKSLLKVLLANHKKHPAASTTTKYCLQILKRQENSTSVNHVLNLLKQCLSLFASKDVKDLCEAILTKMSVNDYVIRTNCMQTLKSLFESQPSEETLALEMNGKLIAAFYDFQPSVNDSQVSEEWLRMISAALSNLFILDNALCLKLLPRFFGASMSFFSSEHQNVVQAAARIMKETSEKCLEPITEVLREDVKKPQSSFKQILKVVESGLHYKYQPVWNVVLRLLQYLYVMFGKTCHSVMMPGIVNLIDLHSNPDFPFQVDLKNAVGAAFKGVGPKLILKERPMNLLREDNVCEFPHAWLLPVMKDNLQGCELQYFVDHFLVLAAELRKKAKIRRQSKKDLEAKVYETLQSQIWALLPGFCTNPVDLTESFKSIAMILGTALANDKGLRAVVLQALRTLISRTTDENELKAIGYYSKNYMPILFNLYTSNDEDCKGVSLSVLETIKMFLLVTDANLVHTFTNKIVEKLKEEKVAIKRHQLMDLAVLMVKYADKEILDQLYSLACANVEEKDKSMQKKAYRIMEEVLECNSESAQRLVESRFEDLKGMFASSLSTAVPSSKAPRLRCISLLVKKSTEEQKDFVTSVIPEVILCTKEVGVKAKSAAFDLLIDIGTSLVFMSNLPKEDCIEEYFKFAMAGLAGSPHMISATLLAFTKLIFEYRFCIASTLVESLLQSAVTLLKSKEREVIKSSLLFIRAVVKILDSNELSEHLPNLIKSLFLWNTRSNSAYRQQVRVILERLDKKCGYRMVHALVPDEHKRFIVQIHKTMMRSKRHKEAQRHGRPDETSKKGTASWQDVLSDSAEDDDEENGSKRDSKKQAKKSKGNKSWILEGEEEVDLLDPKIARSIVASQPKQKRSSSDSGFLLNEDGKLMINDDEDQNIEKPSLDIGATDMLAGFDKTPKQIKLGKRKHLEEMPEETSYQPGGRGIHRDQSKIAKRHGEEYKAKKAKGDVKLKGKPDPFAYIPMDRQKMNKRKRAKLAGQFQGLVKASKRGAERGGSSKRRT